MMQKPRVSHLPLASLLTACICISALLISPALAQVNGPGPSPASSFDTVLDLPGDEAVITGAQFERIGGVTGRTTQLNVSDGGVVGSGFFARSGSEVNVSGGTLGVNFDASGGEVNISGGTIGSSFDALSGSTVNISGGIFGPFFDAGWGSNVTISGGTLGSFEAHSSNVLNTPSVVSISGGTLEELVVSIHAEVELIGSEFRLNGADFSDSAITLDQGDVFTGTLADGSSFIFTPQRSDDLRGVILTEVPLPPLDLNPIVVDAPVIYGPSGLRAGQTLTLQAGGSLRKNFPVVDATLNVEGGTVGEDVEVYRGQVNISGGSVGRRFGALAGSEVNITGGTLGVNSAALTGSEFNISGGTLGFGFIAQSGSVVNISGGTVAPAFLAGSGSEVNISGGHVSRGFDARSGSDVELIGGAFRLNGADYTEGTISLAYQTGEVPTQAAYDDVFTGTLMDGSTFIFTSYRDRLRGLKLTVVPLPPADPNPIVIDTPIVDGPFGLRAGQTLTLQTGGLIDDGLQIVDATFNVEGGIVGDEVEVAGSVVNVSGGDVGDHFDALPGSVVNISGGAVGSSFDAFDGSAVNISGGTVGNSFDAESGSVVDISGGTFGSSFDARSGSEVMISGGTFGGSFGAESGSDAEFVGGEFRLNGVDFTDGTISLADGDIFTGTLADGSSFIFSEESIDRLADVTLTVGPLPPLDLNPLVINTPVVSGPSGLRAGQTLTLQTGGSLRDNFAVVDAELNVEAGDIGASFRASNSLVNIGSGTFGNGFNAYASELNISGGAVGAFFDVFDGSVVNISGGTVGRYFDVHAGSEVNIGGGTVGNDFDAKANSQVNISGGIIGDNFGAFAGSQVNISGGIVGDNFRAFSSEVNINGGTFGDTFTIRANSSVNFFGTEFFIDGVELNGLLFGQAVTITDRNATLTGVLANGEPFSFDLNPYSRFIGNADSIEDDATLTVTLVAPFLLGDCDQNGVVNLFDISPFIMILTSESYLEEADCNEDGFVNLFDISPFISILTGN